MCTFWRKSALAVSGPGDIVAETSQRSPQARTDVIDFSTHAAAAAPIVAQRRYVGVLTTATAQRMQRVIAPYGFAIETCAPDAFLEHLRGPAHVCAIIDPAALDVDHLVETVACLQRQPRPVIVCAPSLPERIQDAVRIASETGAAVAVQSSTQDQRALARTLLAVVPPTDAALLLALLESRLTELPSSLRTCLAAMFAPDAPVQSPASLATCAGMSRRSLDRWLSRVGAPSARRLVTLAPVMRSLRLLRETKLPIRTIASVCGLRSPRRLHDYTIDLTGLAPNEIRAGSDSVETLIERMVASLSGVPG